MIKKFLVATAATFAFSFGAAQAANLDLTTFASTVGTPVKATNLLTLTADAAVQKSVVGVTSFQWYFLSQDYISPQTNDDPNNFNDFGWFSLNGVKTTLASVATTGNSCITLCPTGITNTGANTGWKTFTFATAFTGTLGFGATNYGDLENDSVLKIQNVTAVPEPETYAMMLAGLGLMGAIARRRKAKQA